MAQTHRARVEALLSEAAAEHAELLARLPPDLARSLPVDAQGVIGSFVEGARVRADALGTLADVIGQASLSRAVRNVLVEHPPPVSAEGQEALQALRGT